MVNTAMNFSSVFKKQATKHKLVDRIMLRGKVQKLILAIEVSSNDEIIILKEAPPMQILMGYKCAPAPV